MTREETVLLTRYVKACCPQQAIDKYTPIAWHDILGEYDAAECKAAVAAVITEQPFVAPCEIIAEVRRQRRAELGRRRREQLERDIPRGAICAAPGDDRPLREDIDQIFADFRQRLGQPVPVPARPPAAQMPAADFEAERRRQLAALEAFMAANPEPAE